VKTIFKLAVFLLAACAASGAQAVPAANVASVPITGELQYVLNYSQMATFAGSLGNWQMSTLSGSATYANGKDRFPFSMEYGGGYSWIIAGPSYGAGLFQNLLLSQGIVWRKWNLTASNDVSYLPEAPTTGFTGIPGIGEPIGVPSPAPPNGQSILTLNTVVIDNMTQAQLAHTLNRAISVSGGGSYNIFRYPDGNGLDMNMTTANAGPTWRLDARNSVMATYMYSQFSYPQYNFSLTTNSGTLGYLRVWNRKITTNVSAGPQWLSSSDTATMPSSVGITANASINYQFQSNSASLVYSHGIAGGGGYLVGGELDSLTLTLSRQFGRNLTVGADASYMRTASLGNSPIFGNYGNFDAMFAGVQASRKLGQYFNVFANYTAMTQSSSSALPANVLNQLMQTVSFGIGYSPRSKHLRQ